MNRRKFKSSIQEHHWLFPTATGLGSPCRLMLMRGRHSDGLLWWRCIFGGAHNHTAWQVNAMGYCHAIRRDFWEGPRPTVAEWMEQR